MIATTNPRILLPKIPAKKIPNYLIYEIIDGKPVYYKNYRKVIDGTLSPEEIMRSSGFQGIIIEYILRILYKNLEEKI